MNNSMVCKGIRIAICDDDKLIAIQIKKLVNDILTKTGKEPLIEVYLSGKSFLNSKAIYDIVYKRKNARLKFIKSQSGIGIAISC